MTEEISSKTASGVAAILGATVLAAIVFLALPETADAYTGKTLYSFCSDGKRCKDGWGPGGVVMDSSGDLFGVTGAGGKFGYGVVFEFVPGTGQYTVLHNFCTKTGCKDGSNPANVNLVIDVSGNLYGTTRNGGNAQRGGVVFELVRTDAGWQQVTLHTFCSQKNCTDGYEPITGLTYAGASAGQLYDGVSPLYGATYSGGSGEKGAGGTVYSITPQLGSKKWSEQVLYNFCTQKNCTDGANPIVPPYVNAQGNLFGSASRGGQNGEGGVVFELSPSNSTYVESVLYSFCSDKNCADGNGSTGVIEDNQGNLYGTAGVGPNNDGLIFKLSFNGTQWQFTDLADFDGKNGAQPDGTLIMDANGNLFGTTFEGGTNSTGTVFEFNGSLQTLYNFCKTCVGPTTGVIEDSAGNFYGVTGTLGQMHQGFLYELSP